MRNELQWLFSTFPRGWPGFGLLLLRLAVGVPMVLQGGLYLSGRQSSVSTMLLGVVAAISGVALIIGILTPVAAVLAGAETLGCYLGWLPWPTPNLIDATLPAMCVILVSAALVFLGPGALSLDGRLFGKREVIIPRTRRMPED